MGGGGRWGRVAGEEWLAVAVVSVWVKSEGGWGDEGRAVAQYRDAKGAREAEVCEL